MPKFNALAIESWSLYNTIAILVAATASILAKDFTYLILTFLASVTILIAKNRNALFTKKVIFGYANSITLLRLLLLVFAFFLFKESSNIIFISLITIAVILDFFDGRIARWLNETSFLAFILIWKLMLFTPY